MKTAFWKSAPPRRRVFVEAGLLRRNEKKFMEMQNKDRVLRQRTFRVYPGRYCSQKTVEAVKPQRSDAPRLTPRGIGGKRVVG
jgi:hypothetical protein